MADEAEALDAPTRAFLDQVALDLADQDPATLTTEKIADAMRKRLDRNAQLYDLLNPDNETPEGIEARQALTRSIYEALRKRRPPREPRS